MISVIVCTYNPSFEIINQVISALKNQTLSLDLWELIIIDNASTNQVLQNIDLSFHPRAKVVFESKPGLANARVRGVMEARHENIVFIDDDNVAESRYLELCLKIFNTNSQIGAFGGKALPVFQGYQPQKWFSEFIGLVGCRDLGNQELITQISNKLIYEYPYFAPIGTGMCIRKEVFLQYNNQIQYDSFRQNLGRKGAALTSGEDNDIIIETLKGGWQVAYFPSLVIHHLIPEKRTQKEYLAKMCFAQQKSWVALLTFHHLCPWRPIPSWSVPLRKLKAWVTYKAWLSDVNYIQWKGACGMFEGLAK